MYGYVSAAITYSPYAREEIAYSYSYYPVHGVERARKLIRNYYSFVKGIFICLGSASKSLTMKIATFGIHFSVISAHEKQIHNLAKGSL